MLHCATMSCIVIQYSPRQCILWAGIQYSYVCPSVGGALYILHSTAAAAPTIVNGIIISVLIILTFLDTMIMIMPYICLSFV